MVVTISSGQQLLQHLQSGQVQVYPTGLPVLDWLLSGGVRGEQILELAGHSGTGKTQICLTAAADNLRAGISVHWIDLLGAFKASRLLEIIMFRATPTEKSGPELLSALFVARAEDPVQLLQLLPKFQAHCTTPGLLIIDGIGPTLQELRHGSSQHKQGQALMLSIARGVKAVAQRTGCAVMITNSVDGSCRPLGGEVWAGQAHYTALVKRESNTTAAKSSPINFTIQLETATYLPAGRRLMLPFTIGKDGAYSQQPS